MFFKPGPGEQQGVQVFVSRRSPNEKKSLANPWQQIMHGQTEKQTQTHTHKHK